MPELTTYYVTCFYPAGAGVTVAHAEVRATSEDQARFISRGLVVEPGKIAPIQIDVSLTKPNRGDE